MAIFKPSEIPDNLMKSLYKKKIKSSRQRNIEFVLSFEEFDSIMRATDICPVFGMKMFKDSSGIQTDDSVTLDRIDSSKGYIVGNVVAISYKANSLKSMFENTDNKHRFNLSDFMNLFNWLQGTNYEPQNLQNHQCTFRDFIKNLKGKYSQGLFILGGITTSLCRYV